MRRDVRASAPVNATFFRPASLACALALTVAAVAGTRRNAPSTCASAAALEASEDTTLEDLDCTSTAPAALFGCGAGSDGRPLAARGDLGDTAVWELAGGVAIGSRTSVELAAANRPDLDLDATANFVRTPGAQPVAADGRSLSLMLVAAVDLGPATWRVRPFVTAGGGVARNTTGAVVFTFPGPRRRRGDGDAGRGPHPTSAWTAGAGASLRLGAGDGARPHAALQRPRRAAYRSGAGARSCARAAPSSCRSPRRAPKLATRGVTLSLRTRI